MTRFGLCGHPVAHSLSPKLFAAAYPQADYSYELMTTSDPKEAVRRFWERGFAGMNVTAPLKTSILPFLHRQTPECASIGACNLVLKQNAVPVAHNTDYLGVADSLKEAGVRIKNAACLLLGAGGAAKAAAYALLKEGATLWWANRTLAHIPHSFNGSSIRPISLHEAARYLPVCHIVVNTLPQPVAATQRLKILARHIVFDASYATRPLERQAFEANAAYIGGIRWLLHQALPSFRAMTGEVPCRSEMETCLYPNKSLL